MQTEFTPIISLLGGMLIGLSAVFLMATNGKIAGISGIVSRLLSLKSLSDFGSDFKTGIAFVIGLLAAAPLYYSINGALPSQLVPSNTALLIGAGLLIGVGSALGAGCTSGHGVCGISRGSKRAVAATITFMFTAFVTVYILRHVIGALI